METAARSVKNKLALKYIRDCPLNCAFNSFGKTCLVALNMFVNTPYTANPFPVMTTGISLCVVILPCNDPVKITGY